MGCSLKIFGFAGSTSSKMLRLCAFLLAIGAVAVSERVDYSRHKVLSVTPKCHDDLEILHKLRKDYEVDLWNEPRVLDIPVLVHLRPDMIEVVEKAFQKYQIQYETLYQDLQSVILAEQMMNAPTNVSQAEFFNFGKYNEYDAIVDLLTQLQKKYPDIVKMEKIGSSYENRPIYNMKIGASTNKEAIMIECGIHAREWSSVAACVYFVNKLITSYNEPEVRELVNKYEINVIVEANPDGYIYTWNVDRLWRKTRSRSNLDWLGNCRGADANRNFDIEHCGLGTSRKPCEEIYCGDAPFSESEARAIRDLMITLGKRIKGYFSLHAFSQLWMTPFGYVKKYPENYDDLVRVSKVGTSALAKKYGTRYRVGSIANIIYEAAGSSVDYVYVKQGVKNAFALELRDTGRYGFFLPRAQIIPLCEETYDGLSAAILAL